jgi:hypothetical protein
MVAELDWQVLVKMSAHESGHFLCRKRKSWLVEVNIVWWAGCDTPSRGSARAIDKINKD